MIVHKYMELNFLNFKMFLVYYLVEILMVLISIAYITLLERKILGFIQWRYGPNKVGAMGIFQPFSDAAKLLSKGDGFVYSDLYMYYFMPAGMFSLMIFIWFLFPVHNLVDFDYGILFMIICLSLGVYPIMVGSWYSGSCYANLGSVRSVAQMISYEISFMIILLPYIVNTESFNFGDYEGNGFMNLFMVPLNFMLFISIVIELNRTPSDLIEGESELVSGFNVEYYGMGFTLIFLAEYGMILMMSYFYSLIVFGLNGFYFFGTLLMLLILFLILMIRAVLPRIRYDQLMNLCWMVFLPLSLSYLFMILGFKCLMIYYY